MRLRHLTAAALIGLIAMLPASARQGVALAPTPVAAQQKAATLPASASATRPAGAPTLDRADAEAWLDGFMPFALQRGGVAGGVVAIVKDGQVLLVKGYGWSDVEKRIPVVAERTLFRPGSVSKLFTWTAVMQLVEQGKIDLDKDINAYLDFKIPARGNRPVTMRDLMTHTAGFEERVNGLITPDIENVEPLSEYIPRWVPDRIYEAGSTPAYSNYSTGLAGYIVERVSGQKFETYIDQHVLKPLGMADSSFHQPLPPQLMARMSKGYPEITKPAEEYEYVNPAPAGSLAATGGDMAKFMIAHLQGGRYGSSAILQPATARLMHNEGRQSLAPLNRMLLGFYENNLNGHRVIAHGGDTQLFHSELSLFIDDGVGLFLSLNSGGKEGAAYAIRPALLQQFADRYFPGPKFQGQVDQETAKQHAAMMAGTYESSRRAESSFLAALGLVGQTNIVDNGDGTISVAGFDDVGGAPKIWREISPFVWADRDGDERLVAKVAGDSVRRFSTDGVGAIIVWEPAPWWRSSAWLLPLFYAGLLAMLLTVLIWPVSALVRRSYKAEFPLSGADRRAHFWVRIGALAVLLAVVGWVWLMSAMEADLSLFSDKIIPWLVALRILTLIAFVGVLAAALWNAWRVWKGKRGWPAKVWSVILVLGSAVILWAGLTFKLIGFSVDF